MRVSLKHSSQDASVLVTAIVLAAILGLTLGGYLSWVRTQNVLVAESQAWNAALAHAEAGIEEGMAQINVNFGTNYLDSAQTNWHGGTGFFGPQQHSFGDNCSYSAMIFPTNPGPMIISTGYAMVPIVGRQIARTVLVYTEPSPVFGYGIAVREDVVMGGNNVMVDSYDSFETGGLYDPLKRRAGGDVVSTDGFIDVSGANIYGHVSTAPWGSVSIQRNTGSIGPLSRDRGIEKGWYSSDLNLEFTDVGEPFTVAGVSAPTFYSTTNTYFIEAGDYLVPGDFEIVNGQTLYAAGHARLWVQGNLRGRNGDPGSYIGIAPNASLEVYVGTVDGPPVTATLYNVNSYGSTAASFAYYGLPSNVAMSWSGNQSFAGTIYAPQAELTLVGGGSTTTNDFQGAVVGQSLTMQGHFNFHFDERLKKAGPQKGFVISLWREI